MYNDSALNDYCLTNKYITMELKFITCSGTNETTSIPELLQLLKEFPRAEIGIQVSEKKGAFGTPRYQWIKSLWRELWTRHESINAALHVNLQWVENFSHGIIARELDEFLSMNTYDGKPFIQRVQLNFKIGREKMPDSDKLILAINHYRRQRFILSYNESNKDLIHELYVRVSNFDCLFDESFGTGKIPEKRKSPVYIDILQGYSGGINPDNVIDVLNEIVSTDTKGYCTEGFYIDAQKGLEDEFTHFDLNKCRAYLTKAENWYQDYQHRTKI